MKAKLKVLRLNASRSLLFLIPPVIPFPLSLLSPFSFQLLQPICEVKKGREGEKVLEWFTAFAVRGDPLWSERNVRRVLNCKQLMRGVSRGEVRGGGERRFSLQV